MVVEAGGRFEAFQRFLASAGQPVLRHEVERALPDAEEDESQRLYDWIEEFQLLVPLLQQGELRGFLGVGPKLTGGRFHSEDLALLSLLSQQVNTSLENVRLLSENVQKRILEEEIALASEIQHRLLPSTFPSHRGYESFAVSHASKTVGGDYFDLFSLGDHKLYLAIADVAGKGMAAALLMSSLRAALRSNVPHFESPAHVLTRINNLLFESTSPEKFATFFYGVLDTETHELVYANAGHNYPVVLHVDGATTELRDGGLILGAFPDVEYADGRLQLDPGEILFLYTDGVTEATNRGEDDFGEERLYEVLRRGQRLDPRQMVQSVLDEVKSFTAGADPTDDVTMLIVRRHGEEYEDWAAGLGTLAQGRGEGP
jgi:sigma-B regulation protein RsbU (phosphoserine phosphatase)